MPNCVKHTAVHLNRLADQARVHSTLFNAEAVLSSLATVTNESLQICLVLNSTLCGVLSCQCLIDLFQNLLESHNLAVIKACKYLQWLTFNSERSMISERSWTGGCNVFLTSSLCCTADFHNWWRLFAVLAAASKLGVPFFPMIPTHCRPRLTMDIILSTGFLQLL